MQLTIMYSFVSTCRAGGYTTRSFRSWKHHHHHLSLLSSQPPPSATIIITTTITFCHFYHQNHHHLPLSSSQPPSSATIIIIREHMSDLLSSCTPTIFLVLVAWKKNLNLYDHQKTFNGKQSHSKSDMDPSNP